MAVYFASGNKAIITGNSGIYNDAVNNASVRYGRNAASNFQAYSKDLMYISDEGVDRFEALMAKTGEISEEESFKELMDILNNSGKRKDINEPEKFEYRYAPKNRKGELDIMALMGAAFEDLGKKVSLSIEKAAKTLKLPVILDEKHGHSLEALDLNEDKRIDIAEYGTYLLLCDGRSYDADDADTFFPPAGMINKQGWQNTTYFLNDDDNIKEYASRVFAQLYSDYDLGRWQQDFTKDTNNMVDVKA